jgi:hypothetical protein
VEFAVQMAEHVLNPGFAPFMDARTRANYVKSGHFLIVQS